MSAMVTTLIGGRSYSQMPDSHVLAAIRSGAPTGVPSSVPTAWWPAAKLAARAAAARAATARMAFKAF